MSTVRDACTREGIRISNELRMPVLRMFRRVSALVKGNAGVVTIISIPKAARLVQVMTGNQALVDLVTGLRNKLPPAVYRHAGSRDDAYREADEAMQGEPAGTECCRDNRDGVLRQRGGGGKRRKGGCRHRRRCGGEGAYLGKQLALQGTLRTWVWLLHTY